MTAAIIITLCALLLIAYSFDLTSEVTKIPSVILLLILGWIVKQLLDVVGLNLPDLSSILPVIATMGLVLIVLEGSLELEVNKSKLRLINKSFWGALLPIIALSFLIAFAFQKFGDYPLKTALINAIPLSIISSAIAIPSVRNLSRPNREFVIYESSLSDIIGVIFFNFIALNATIGKAEFGNFGIQLLLILIISFVATIGLSLLLSQINHHIKFVPIILIVILLYEVMKIYHLPALVFILLFGLAIGNLDELSHFKWMKRFHPEELNREVIKFKDITIEAAFLIRSLFFILFGFLLELSDILNFETMVWAAGIVLATFIIRAIQLALSSLPITPLLFVAPRGLITILLFISIAVPDQIPLVNKSLIIQVIILTAVVMMFGLMTSKKEVEKPRQAESVIEDDETTPDSENEVELNT